MGVFERIRTASPYLLATFAAVFILFMVLGDMNMSSLAVGNQSAENRVVANIKGEDLLYSRFEQVVKNATEQQRFQAEQAGQEFDVSDKEIRSSAFRQLIDLNLKTSMIKEAGVNLSDKVIGDIVVNDPPEELRRMFSDSTGFRKDLYLRAATDPSNFVNIVYPQSSTEIGVQQRKQITDSWKTQLINSSDAMKNRLIESNSRSLMNNVATFESNLSAWDEFKGNRSYADLEIVYLPYSSVDAGAINITEDQINDYYNKNKESFTSNATRKIAYVYVPFNPSKEDSVKASKLSGKLRQQISDNSTTIGRVRGFEKAFDEIGGTSEVDIFLSEMDPTLSVYIKDAKENDVLGPVTIAGASSYIKVDRISDDPENALVNASHILINFNNNKDSAYTAALEIYNKIKDDSENFAGHAREYSKGPSSTQGGELGWFGKGAMVPDFEKAVYGANLNEITKPIETQFGYHIILVKDKSTKKYSYSQVSIKPSITRATKNKIYIAARNLSEKAKAGSDLKTAAGEFELNYSESGFFEKDQQVLGSGYASWFAFNNPVGTVSDAFEIDGIGAVVLKVLEANPAGVPNKETIKNEVTFYTRVEQRNELALTNAKTIYESVKNGNFELASGIDPKAQFIETSNTKNDGTIKSVPGKEFAITAKAFAMEEGQISEPIKGSTGIFILKLKSKVQPDVTEMKTSFETFKQNLIRQNSSIYYSWFRDIKSNIDYQDNRAEIYRTNF